MTDIAVRPIGVMIGPVGPAGATGATGPAGPGLTGLSRRQVIAAMVDVTNPAGVNILPTIRNAVNPLCTDTGSIQWEAASYMQTGDALYAFIQATMGWSGPQMTAFAALAATKTL